MKIVALLTIRNEKLYLEKCLDHLISQGVEVCVIDNESTDGSFEIAHKYLNKGVIKLESLVYRGCFELFRICKNEERLASEIKADWFIHHDADEIRNAPNPFKSIKEAIEYVDRKGFNSIDHDEFVFLPHVESLNKIPNNYVNEMRHYYYLKVNRLNAWKNLKTPVDIASSGGHKVSFRDQRVYPEKFILRHYIALSKTHLIEKFSKRKYSKHEIEDLKWFKKRALFDSQKVELPRIDDLKEINDSNNWDRSSPFNKHLFF